MINLNKVQFYMVTGVGFFRLYEKDSVKRETGVNPVRTRHRDEGAFGNDVTE